MSIRPTYTVYLLCPNGHQTTTELLHAVLTPDGMIEGAAGSDADFCAVCNASPLTVLGINEETPLCQWVALCENDATTYRLHPILGDVPICARCNARCEALDAEGNYPASPLDLLQDQGA